MSTVRCLLIGAAAAAVLVLLAPALGQATSDDPAPATFTTRLQPPWSLVTVTAHTTAGALVDDDPSVVALYR